MKKLLFFSVVFSFFFSCSNSKTDQDKNIIESENTESENDVSKYVDFNEAYSTFFWALVDKDEKNVNSFIHPEMGMYIIESNGALPSFSLVKDIATYKKISDGKSFFSIDMEKVGTEPLLESLPEVTCDDNVYNKQGCFTQKINKLKDAGIWDLSDIKAEDKNTMELLSETIQYTVVNTANYTFYFSQINGFWYVTFIDIRIPCVA